MILRRDLLEPTAGSGATLEEWTVAASPVAHTAPAHIAPDDGRSRARRTDGILAHLRVVDLDDDATRHQLRNQLIETNAAMARSIAGRYRNRGVDLEDLEQVALVALTKAAQRFDPAAGHDFMSYAVPTIRGELRRHFRDAGWVVRPPRRVQELQARIRRSEETLQSELGRSPRPTEVAACLGVDLEDVVEALTADGCFTPTSLDGPVGRENAPLGDLLGHDDDALEAAEARILLGPVVKRLPERDRRILHLRFVEELTQEEIANRVGVTQAQVSRRLTHILAQLRADLSGRNPAA